MNTKQDLALVVFDRDKITYGNRSSGAPVVFSFTPDLVHYGDIVDKDKLATHLSSFIDTNKLVSSPLVFLMSDQVLFTKDILPPTPPVPVAPATPKAPKLPEPIMLHEEEEKLIKKYIDSVPFEKVAYKIYPLGAGKRIIATNAVVAEVVKEVFEKKGFSLAFSVPASILGSDVLSSGVSAGLVTLVSAKVEWLRSQAFHIDEDIPVLLPSQPRLLIGGKTDYKRLAIMGGVFAVLLIIMIVMYRNSQTPLPVKPATTLPVVKTVILPTASLSPSPSSVASASATPIGTPSAVQLAQLQKVQIISSGATVLKAQQVKTALNQAGFGIVDISSSQGTIGGSSSVVSVSSSVPQSIRSLVLQAIHLVLPGAILQETVVGKYTITITIQG